MGSSGHRFWKSGHRVIVVPNCWLNGYGKLGGAGRRAAVFFAICEKPEGADNRPPGRARVNLETPAWVFAFMHSRHVPIMYVLCIHDCLVIAC